VQVYVCVNLQVQVPWRAPPEILHELDEPVGPGGDTPGLFTALAI
jgi:hypothetical protein